jgi:hypothetical protein
MTEGRLSAATFWLAAVDAAACLVFGVLHPLLGEWDSQTDRVIFVTLVVGGGSLMLAGLFVFDRSPRASAALIGVGALAGALGLAWTIVVPLVAVTLVALSVTRVRLLRRGEAADAPLCDDGV